MSFKLFNPADPADPLLDPANPGTWVVAGSQWSLRKHQATPSTFAEVDLEIDVSVGPAVADRILDTFAKSPPSTMPVILTHPGGDLAQANVIQLKVEAISFTYDAASGNRARVRVSLSGGIDLSVVFA